MMTDIYQYQYVDVLNHLIIIYNHMNEFVLISGDIYHYVFNIDVEYN